MILNIYNQSFEIEDTGLSFKDKKIWIRRIGFHIFIFIGEIESWQLNQEVSLLRRNSADELKNELLCHGDAYKKALKKFKKLVIFE